MDEPLQSTHHEWRAPHAASLFSNLPLVLGSTVVLLVLKLVVTVVYNIHFHPLSKYPGPKIAAATSLTYWVIGCRGQILPWTNAQHVRYGAIVRLGPDRLSYTDPQAWKDIYGHRTGKQRAENPKDPRTYTKAFNGEDTIVTVRDPRDHGALRKIFTHAFSDRALKLQEPLIQKYVDKLIFNMRRDTGALEAQFDMVTMYNCTTFDIMGELAFGEPLGLLENSEYTPWVKTIFGGIKASQFLRIQLEYPWLGRLSNVLMPASVKNKRKEHFEYSVERVNRRLEKGTDKPDIWHLVLTNNQGQLSTPEMHSNASIFMVAGTETTATLLSGLTYYLLKNTPKLEKVVQEVRGLSEDELSLENLPRLPYLAACFEEGLRIYPPVPSSLPREVAEGGQMICGQWVPPKTRVAVPQLATYRSPLNFKDPHSFIPERWISGFGYDDDRKDALQPFSTGPRNCLGKNLAYHEMRIILAKILWNFDLELCQQSESWADQDCYVLWEKPALWVRAKPIH